MEHVFSRDGGEGEDVVVTMKRLCGGSFFYFSAHYFILFVPLCAVPSYLTHLFFLSLHT